jgi:hypothetical protein
MGDIVNLRRVRKAKRRDETERQADINRAKFGQNKATREKTAAELKLEADRLDAHKRPDKP